MDHTVIVYSTPTCSWCMAVKQHLRSHAVSFEEIDVSTDLQKVKAIVEKSGQYGVPVVDIDGEIVVGFDRPRIDALLGIA